MNNTELNLQYSLLIFSIPLTDCLETATKYVYN